ncbi:ImmA/IrrE family metallo-endopeptidase [Pelagibacterium nitratireducens]|uniref:ImmA/IrrE family metallo-endopeptidase n=1 Tax=Pelagibacterium nitratireducens TaxID=1046114 RepID=A0ABZ2I1B3_9HYPH
MPLSAFALAEQQKVTIWREREIAGLSAEHLNQLAVVANDEWLALTLRLKDNFLVVYNSSQSPDRVNSMIMHELSHIILGHELTSAGLSEEGYLMPTTYDQEQEDEANWLGGTLLLPRPALLHVRYHAMSDSEISQRYGVSSHMLKWRFRMTGVDYQISHAKRRA